MVPLYYQRTLPFQANVSQVIRANIRGNVNRLSGLLSHVHFQVSSRDNTATKTITCQVYNSRSTPLQRKAPLLLNSCDTTSRFYLYSSSRQFLVPNPTHDPPFTQDNFDENFSTISLRTWLVPSNNVLFYF